MATITISLTSPLVTGSKNYTLNDAAVMRLINAYKIIFERRGFPGLNNAQTLGKWADEFVAASRRQVKEIEDEAAVQAVSDLTVT